jgi:maleate isomerase
MSGASPGPRPDYGPRARIGIATPQANPTVEPELRLLLPEAIAVYATRLVHASPRVEERLEHYVRHIPEAIATFGTLRLAAFGFGCTGSSYLAGCQLEDRLTAEAAARCKLPVITAAQAIRAVLAELGAGAIALVSPYPVPLAEAGYRYWESAGIRIAAKIRVDPELTDTHRIYELTSEDALAAITAVDRQGAQCIVVSGTGLPTIKALRAVRDATPIPVVSSNLCLAWALLRVVAPEMTPPHPADLLA